MLEEKKIKKRKKAKHRLKARMKRRVYIILATSFFAIGIAAIINFNINTALASIMIYLATGIGCAFILFLYIFRLIKGRKRFVR